MSNDKEKEINKENENKIESEEKKKVTINDFKPLEKVIAKNQSDGGNPSKVRYKSNSLDLYTIKLEKIIDKVLLAGISIDSLYKIVMRGVQLEGIPIDNLYEMIMKRAHIHGIPIDNLDEMIRRGSTDKKKKFFKFRKKS